MNYQVLIVEDEPLIADDLSFHLQDIGINNIQIAFKYQDAIEKLGNETFDLVLLDINLSGTHDGIDLAKFIDKTRPVPFIFVTSYYDKVTLDRVQVTNPAAYILKPFVKADIQVNVQMVLFRLSKLRLNNTDRFFVKDNDGLHSLDPSHIAYVEAFDNYAKVFTDSKVYIVSHTLKSIEDKLLPFGFERVHKSYLINFRMVTRISEGYVFFNETKVPIGRAYKQDFMTKISLL